MQSLVDDKKEKLLKQIKVKIDTLKMEMQSKQYSSDFQKIVSETADKFNCSTMVVYSSWHYFLSNGKSPYNQFNKINSYILTRLNSTL